MQANWDRIAKLEAAFTQQFLAQPPAQLLTSASPSRAVSDADDGVSNFATATSHPQASTAGRLQALRSRQIAVLGCMPRLEAQAAAMAALTGQGMAQPPFRIAWQEIRPQVSAAAPAGSMLAVCESCAQCCTAFYHCPG